MTREIVFEHGVVTVSVDTNPADQEERIVRTDVGKRRVSQAVQSLDSLPLLRSVELILATDFNRTTREVGKVLTGSTYASTYTYLRPNETAVAARALVDADGKSAIVIHAALLSGRRKHRELQQLVGLDAGLFLKRLIRHEGWHTVIQQRDGHAARSRGKRASPNVVVSQLAANIIEEYRVERTMFESGWWRGAHEVGPKPLISSFRGLRHAPLEPVDSSVERFLESKLGRGQGATQLVGHEAARVLVQGLEAEREFRSSRLWNRGGGEYWDQTLELLAQVPSADWPMDEAAMAKAVRQLAPVARNWLERVGVPLSRTARPPSAGLGTRVPRG